MGGEATAKRLAIVKDLAGRIVQFSEGILLGGSVAAGTARDDSDIDLAIVVKKGAARPIVCALNFEHHPSGRSLNGIDSYNLGCAWASENVQGVKVNCFLYNAHKLEQYVTLQKPMDFWREDKPNEVAQVHGFDGKERKMKRAVTEFWGGYCYEIPALFEEKFYTHAIREQVLGAGGIIAQHDNFLTNLSNAAWRATVQQLIKEHGENVDLKKYSVLNTIYAFQKGALSQEKIDEINRRTVKELNNYAPLKK